MFTGTDTSGSVTRCQKMSSRWDGFWDAFCNPFAQKASQDDFVLEPPNGYTKAEIQQLKDYQFLRYRNQVPPVRAWVKRNPEMTWTVFLGQKYNPQACLKKTYHDQGYAVVMARFWVEKWRIRHVEFWKELHRG